ncbi:amino acid permease [Halorubrum yunnanense]|uniref:Amino acid permease n=1 Tax=Halorubrum yunnanense TaxID=1526162 RepID=A0ABD5YGM4_9EURY|nr:amino acid permease [Halorubrum yunnanense]
MVDHTRTLDFKIAFAIGLGTMIAAGIFSLSGTAVAEIGSSAVIAFVLAAVVAGLTAASYSEFASIYSENGGGYLFSSRTFEHDTLVYAVGAMLFLGYTGTTAFYLATMDEWVVRFILPESLHVLPHGTSGVLAALLLGALNARGTEESGTFQLFVTGAKVAVLLAFVGGAVAFRGPAVAADNFAAGFSADPVGIVSIAALAFITFFGFSAIAASAGEIIEPRRTVPLAIGASILTVTVLYALVIVSMVNSPVPAEIIAEEGETAMGRVAAGFLGPAGRSLIVAGAIFSMVSASNASILAASGIGSLMGRQGQAPRPFSRIHRQYGTPFWSVASATGVIVTLIVVFIGLFPAEGGVVPFDFTVALPGLGAITFTELGLTTLTGFATLNLLLPLSVVNIALIYSRRRYSDIDRGFRVPGVPLIPVVGVIANVALITNLPVKGVLVGGLLIAGMLAAYLIWGGEPDMDELYEEVAPPSGHAGRVEGEGTVAEAETTATDAAAADAAADVSDGATETPAEGSFRILVPVARPERAVRYARLAAAMAEYQEGEPFVDVLTVTQIPEQTPYEAVEEITRGRITRIRELLAAEDLDASYAVEGHTCRDVGFDIVQTARDKESELVVMGYPEEHTEVAEHVEYKAPCGVLFASGVLDSDALDVVNIGAGGGPHHMDLLSLIDRMGERDAEINVINITPEGGEGRPENTEATVSGLPNASSVRIHNITAQTIADGLVDQARENGGILIIGATRTRRLRRRVFGSTPDNVIKLAQGSGVPVLVYASPRGVQGPIEEYVYPVYRYLKGIRRGPTRATESKIEE